MVAGYEQRVEREQQRAAWSLQYQLIAAGCKPESVTVEKLLGLSVGDEEGSAAPAEKTPIDVIWRMMPRIGEPASAPAGKESDGVSV